MPFKSLFFFFLFQTFLVKRFRRSNRLSSLFQLQLREKGEIRTDDPEDIRDESDVMLKDESRSSSKGKEAGKQRNTARQCLSPEQHVRT